MTRSEYEAEIRATASALAELVTQAHSAGYTVRIDWLEHRVVARQQPVIYAATQVSEPGPSVEINSIRIDGDRDAH